MPRLKVSISDFRIFNPLSILNGLIRIVWITSLNHSLLYMALEKGIVNYQISLFSIRKVAIIPSIVVIIIDRLVLDLLTIIIIGLLYPFIKKELLI